MPRRKEAPLPQTPIKELWNMSPTTAGWLAEIGIETYEQLASSDLFEVWSCLKKRHSQVTALMFFALWGAVNNCHWNHIPDPVRAEFETKRS